MPVFTVSYQLKDVNSHVFKSGTIKIEAENASQAERKAKHHFYNIGEIDYLGQAHVIAHDTNITHFNDIGDR